MKINGKITILANPEGVTIEVNDDDASIRFLTIKMTPEQFVRALSREAHIRVESIEVVSVDKLGKKMENDSFVFELPEGYNRWNRSITDEELAEYVDKLLPKGWKSDRYFRSQNSFFEKDGKKYGRAIIRRWV